jgi:DNA-binding LacI/PurR family transcriptional regulator
MTRRISMFDVADYCGVSHQTVSRVVNETGSVSPKTRDKVLAAIAHLGYQPNLAAKALATGRTQTIGVLTFDSTLYGPTAMLHSIQVAAREAGYQVVLNSVDNISNSAISEGIATLAKSNVDGVLVIAPRSAAADSRILVETRVPIMFTETQDGEPFGTVDIDQAGLGNIAVELLVGLGHTRIAHITGNPDWLAAERRKDGYLRALSTHSLSPGGVAEGDWTPASGYEATKTLLAGEPFTAIFVANDAMAIGSLRALSEAGRSVPAEVSLVSIDDSAESEFTVPALTSVRQQFDKVGASLLSRLLEQIEGSDGNQVETSPSSSNTTGNLFFPGVLVARESAAQI